MTSSSGSGTPIRQKIADRTIEAMSLKQKLKAALHASTVQSMRAFQGQTLKNLKRNSDAAHGAVYGVSGMKAGDSGPVSESDEMGPMILGDYNVHQTTSTPAPSATKRSLAGEAVKLAIAAGIATTGVGLPTAIAIQGLWPKKDVVVPETRKSFTDATIEIVLPYEAVKKVERGQ